MALVQVKKACERLLKNSFPTLKIAYEGVSFTPPNNELYLRVTFNIARPDDVVLGANYYRENIVLGIFVVDTANKGTTNALTKAEEIRNVFHKGLTLVEDAIRMHIFTTPQIAGTSATSDKVVIPIRISITAEVES